MPLWESKFQKDLNFFAYHSMPQISRTMLYPIISDPPYYNTSVFHIIQIVLAWSAKLFPFVPYWLLSVSLSLSFSLSPHIVLSGMFHNILSITTKTLCNFCWQYPQLCYFRLTSKNVRTIGKTSQILWRSFAWKDDVANTKWSTQKRYLMKDRTLIVAISFWLTVFVMLFFFTVILETVMKKSAAKGCII